MHVDESPGLRPSRAAFAVSKAVGGSVVRHRVTRRLRAQLLPLLDRLPSGTDVVVRALPEAATASSADLRIDLEHALGRVTTLSEPEPGPEAVVTAAEQDEPETVHRSGVGRVLWWIGWPIRSLLLGLIWVYRNTVSPMLPPTCRYHPSCSAYGFEALRVHGAAKGAVLAGWRVLRCNPFTPGGLDPVPERGSWRPSIHPDGTPRVAPMTSA